MISNHMALLPSGAVASRGPTLMNAATRAFAKSMTWLCAIVFVAAAIDPSGQCIHDQMAGTLVVRRPNRYETRVRSVASASSCAVSIDLMRRQMLDGHVLLGVSETQT